MIGQMITLMKFKYYVIFFSYIPISLVGILVSWTHGLYYYPETYSKISDFLASL